MNRCHGYNIDVNHIILLTQIVGGHKPFIGQQLLEREHERFRTSALDTFNSKRKMGGDEFSHTYLEKLISEIEELHENFVKQNDSKNIFAAARTPAVLFSIIVVCYVIAALFGMLSLETIANLINLVMLATVLLLFTWSYIKYSGEYSDVGVHIDNFIEFIWEQVG